MILDLLILTGVFFAFSFLAGFLALSLYSLIRLMLW